MGNFSIISLKFNCLKKKGIYCRIEMLVKHANSISKSYWGSEKIFHCSSQVLHIENICSKFI